MYRTLPDATGDVETDNEIGRQIAGDVITEIREHLSSPGLLANIAQGNGARRDGVVVGFWTAIGLKVGHPA